MSMREYAGSLPDWPTPQVAWQVAILPFPRFFYIQPRGASLVSRASVWVED